MWSNKEIRDFLYNAMTMTDDAVDHFSFVLSDIQNALLLDIPPGKFVECCINEDWERAYLIGDFWNREALSKIVPKKQKMLGLPENFEIDKSSFIILFIKQIKETPEYREKTLSKVLDDN